ncbi:Mu transposase C-terminal domain-containing protein [Sphingomonas sp. Leaf10]|uniref:Mu transposase C-terminal domain-containing protein n=1 Tax=Sphingomonas sp. Leaf10 TaxID=1735676 RepID=UPI000AC5D2EB|nr:Mu transposase C-terminal domain-containing protein [Sphingomonas sp. Leaf10]
MTDLPEQAVFDGSAIHAETVDGDDITASPERLKIAMLRKPVLDRLLALPKRTYRDVGVAAEELNCSIRTVFTLLKRYGATRRLTDLAPLRRSSLSGRSMVDPRVEAVISDVIASYHLSRMRPTITQTILEVRRRTERLGLRLPDQKTVRKRIAAIPTVQIVRSREGAKRAREQFGLVSGSTPETTFPLQRIQIDHTRVDLIVVDEALRQPLERPWITVAIDEYSRAVLGFYLSLEAPSSTSVGLCLVHSILPKDGWAARIGLSPKWLPHGRPDEIYTDNGADFRSEAVELGCRAWGMAINFRPGGMPHFGGIVERVIGTAMRSLRTLPGATGGSIVERGDTDPAKEASLTMQELELLIATFIAGHYHCSLHSHHGMTPNARWQAGIFGNKQRAGRGVPTPISDPARLLIDFLPIERRSVSRRGIRWGGILYMDDILRPYLDDQGRRKFVVRRDPRDVSRIWFLCPDDNIYYPVRSRDISRPSITAWELENARKLLRASGQRDYDETALFRAAELAQEIVEKSLEARKASRKSRLANERRNGAKISQSYSETRPESHEPASASPWRRITADDLEGDEFYEVDE